MLLKDILPKVSRLFRNKPACTFCDERSIGACGGCTKIIHYKEGYADLVREYGEAQVDAVVDYVIARNNLRKSYMDKTLEGLHKALVACKKAGIEGLPLTDADLVEETDFFKE